MSEQVISELFKKADISKGVKIKIYDYSESFQIFTDKAEIKEGYVYFYKDEKLIKTVPINLIRRIDIYKSEGNKNE